MSAARDEKPRTSIFKRAAGVDKARAGSMLNVKTLAEKRYKLSQVSFMVQLTPQGVTLEEVLHVEKYLIGDTILEAATFDALEQSAERIREVVMALAESMEKKSKLEEQRGLRLDLKRELAHFSGLLEQTGADELVKRNLKGATNNIFRAMLSTNDKLVVSGPAKA